MSVDFNMQKITSKLKSIKKYDIEGFVYDLSGMVHQLWFFHNKLIPEEDENGDDTFYTPTPAPKINQLAYFNLGHGYPKELYGGHWCYIINEFKTKYLIIPTTSLKDGKLIKESNFPIEIKDFENDSVTVARVEEIRTIDKMRIFRGKPFYDILTSKEEIISKINENMYKPLTL